MTLSAQDRELRFDDGDDGIDEIIATGISDSDVGFRSKTSAHCNSSSGKKKNQKKYQNGFTRCFSIRDAAVVF